MIKMLVSSFYNTLINEEEAIPTSTMLELDQIRQKKILFVVLTNRLFEEVMYYNQDYPFIDYIISLNGGLITNVEKNESIALSAFTSKEIREIEKYFEGKKLYYYTEKECKQEFSNEKVYKIEIPITKKEAKEISFEKYKTSIFSYDKKDYLEISKNTSYEALQKLLKQTKVKKEEVLGILGNESERTIAENFEKIYAVRNAPKEIKEITGNITKSNKLKGVEFAILKEIK